ncbi:L-carnitine dehydratase/bile acid-inducible protein F, partial [sediment metagenome]
QRHRTGRGQKVASSLFETTVYLVGQHMAQKAVTGQAAQPMPVRISAWAIYDVFETRDGEQVFVGVVSDSLWERFLCGVRAGRTRRGSALRDELTTRHGP